MSVECSYGIPAHCYLTSFPLLKGKKNRFPSTITKEKQDGDYNPLVVLVTFSRAKEIKW